MTIATLPLPRRRPACAVLAPEVRPRGDGPVVVLAHAHEERRAIYAMVLRHAGFQVLEAEAGEEVIRLACAWGPHAVVMAVALRGVDGLRAAEVLAEHPVTHHIPVLLLGAAEDEALEARVRDAGCTSYLLAPCAPGRLLEEVQRCVPTAVRGGATLARLAS